MAAMGFSRDPGPLPFVTIRDAKWANRLAYLPMPLRIHGEHGCAMPRQIGLVTKVVSVRPQTPSLGRHPYATDRQLVAVHLEKPPPCGVHAWDREWGMCAHCGEPLETTQ